MKQIPNFTISKVRGNDHSPDDIIVHRFSEYLTKRGFLFQPHRHTFYHLVYFTKGSGKHYIDFVSFPVTPGQIYFMNPGQVHHWEFSDDVDGYIINFSDQFFRMLPDPEYLSQFFFFSGNCEEQVVQLSANAQQEADQLFTRILRELTTRQAHMIDMARTLLLQLFIAVSRDAGPEKGNPIARPGMQLIRNFRKLVEQHFAEKRLPKEYAALLFVTPNYLNALCKEVLGMPAGEVIRERILLEAKRLLVNAGMNITEIAYQLNFQDNSYFSRFFKKYNGVTPEEFRRQYHVDGVSG
jgi:AraC-like DNA-binding protein